MMRKGILGFAVLFLFTATGFASLENTATAGLFFNDLDNVMDELDIFSVEKNVSDLGIQGWNNTSLNSGIGINDVVATLGIVNGLPIKLGVQVFWSENITGNPGYSNSQQITYLDTDADTYYDSRQDISTAYQNYNYSSLRNVKIVAALPGNTMSFSYAFYQNLSRQEATFAPTTTSVGAVSTGNVSQMFDLSGNLISETGTRYGNGYSDNGGSTHTVTWAMKLGKMLLYIPVSLDRSTGSSGTASVTNWTYNPGTVIPYPTYGYSYVTLNNKYNTLSLNPTLRLIMKESADDYFEIYAKAGFGIGLFRGDGLVRQYYSVTTNLALVYNVETTVNTTDNKTFYDNIAYLPFSLQFYPYVNKKVSEKVRIGYGLRALAYYTINNHSFNDTNVSVVNFNDGDTEANDPNDYVQTTRSYSDSYTVYNNELDAYLQVPVALQYALSKVTTLRLGAILTLNYNSESTTTAYENDKPTETTTVYGNGSTDTTYGALSSPTSFKNIVSSFDTTMTYYTGAGFALDENLNLDLVLTGTTVTVFNDFDIQLKYVF